ncbi:MAG: sugar phosphate nucleotidyltransferase [Prevotella sp.]|nr:sugar phosphate nucleotidyltransferase [Prevotella sp.]
MKNQNVKKAVILCAGKGTRMMPYTKSQPKEMLPVLTTPLLQIIIDQVVEAGIKEIFILISDNKECIVNHFNGLYPDVKISYGRQVKMEGTGPATMIAKDFINHEPFLLIFPDELMLEQNPYKVLIEDFNRHHTSVLSSYQIPLELAHRYGIIIPKKGNEIKGIVEKPKSNPPSNLASLGTYVLVPEVLDFVREHIDGEGEICIVDAINKLPKLRHIALTGKRFDLGSPLGFVQATTYATYKAIPEFKPWLQDLLKE